MFDPTEKATAVPEFRIRFLRLLHGATDEHSDDSVPANNRQDFCEHVQYNVEHMQAWFERNNKRFGSSDGRWLSIPDNDRAEALGYWGWKMATFANKCEFELDLLRIDQEQEADAAFDRALKVD